MAENNVTITWDNTPIEIIDRDSLELNKIDDNGTIGEMIDTINANFQNIAKHGGGPAGKDGTNGTNGVDGTSAEYIYALSDVMEPGEQYPLDDLGKEELFERVHNGGHAGFPEGSSNITWYEHAQPITEDQKNEYVLIRYKTSFGTWVYERTPVLWAHWGESGTDGDGVEYIFLTSSSEFTDSKLNDLVVKKINLDKYQRAIFQIDDFYPGTGWFIDKNKSVAKKALDAAGVSLSDSNFDQKWRNNFNFVNEYNWSDDPVGTSALIPYEYVSIRRSKKDDNGIKEWTDYSKPALWSSYGLPTRTFIVYYNGTKEKPVKPSGGWWNVDDDLLITNHSNYPLLPTGWKSTDEDINGAIVWISYGIFDHSGENVSWSDPVRITGENGEKGEDGTLMEFIYTLSDTMVKGQDYPSSKQVWKDLFDSVEDPEHPADGITIGTDSEGLKYVDYNGTHWYDRARSITDKKKTEYVWIRTRVGTTGEWTYSDPTIWARWGEDGTDGDGVEYIFHTSTEKWSVSAVQKPFERPPLLDNMTGTLGEYCKAVFQMSDFYPNSAWFTNENRERVRQYIDSLENTSLNGTTLDNKWNDIKNFFNLGWTDNPKGTDMTNLYEYVSVRRSKTVDGVTTWGDFSLPALWSNYNNKSRVFIVYYNSETEDEPDTPTGGFWDVASDRFVTNDPSHPLSEGWSDTDREEIGKYTWMSSGAFHENDYVGDVKPVWSKPHRITGADGEKGKDGTNIEFIYALCNVREMYPGTHYPTAGTGNVNWENLFNTVEDPNNPAEGVVVETDEEGIKYVKYGEVHWYDRALSITEENKVEFCWSRYKSVGTDEWQYDQKPFIWAHWGEDGTDGDGVEYIFALSENDREFNNWDTNTVVSGLSELETLIYSSNDFCPNSEWFDNSTIKSRVQTEIQRKGYTISSADFNDAWISMKTKFSFDVKGLGSWTDNPSDISPNYPYQYVSIRKSPNGVWDPFSSPKLWTKYNNNRYTSFVFTAVKPDEDLSQFTVIGGSFDNPIPNPPYGKTLNRSGVEVEGITWTDNPQPDGSNTEIWMISAKLMEGYTAPDGVVYPEWSKPKRMVDSSELNIEWSANSLTPEQVTKLNDFLSTEAPDPNDPEKTYCPYNFGVFMSQYDFDEAAAEAAWRTAVHDALYEEPDLHYNVNFSDNAEDAVLMATCQMRNGVWSNWKVTRVKGEKGDDGTHIVVKGRISHEVYMPDGTDYIYSLVNDEREHATLKNEPIEGDLLIVYPHEANDNGIYLGDSSYGYGLYMWKYENHGWVDYNNKTTSYPNNEEPNNTYTSPNNHMIIWDGDSWQDVGEIHGPVGPECKILIKYANDDPNTGGKVFVSNKDDIPAAKWIGVLTYTEGSEDPESFTESDPKWTWSLFKGQDGYGHEYIYKQTSDEIAPEVPATTVTQDNADGSVPSGWNDEPIEPTTDYKYIWMCWRKHNNSEGKWGKFVGKDGKTAAQSGVARLWQVYAKSITTVNEYFHADTTISPSDTAFNGDPRDYTSYWKVDKSDWNGTNRYLFNKEVVTYSDGSVSILDTHFVAIWADGIKDVIDYYILDTDGESAPYITNGVPKTSGSHEGEDYWTTNASKTKINSSQRYLWNISKRVYDGTKDDEWSTPVVIGVYNEAVNGEDSIYIDLDNEMDTVQIDENRKVIKGKTCKSTVKLYKGSDLLKIGVCQISGEETLPSFTRKYYVGNTSYDSIPSGGCDSVEISFDVTDGSTLASESLKIVFSVTSTEATGSVVRKASYTIAGTTHPTLYSIKPDESAIIINGSTCSPNPLKLSVVALTGSEKQTYTGYSVSNPFKLYVQKNGGSKTEVTNDPFSYATSGLSAGDKLTFTVDVTNGGSSITLDTETVYVLLQGKNGDKGETGNGYQYKYARGNSTTVTITSTSSNTPTIKVNGTSVTVTDTPQGVNENNTYEFRTERFGYSGNWSVWSTPVVIAKYLTPESMTDEINSAVSSATSQINQNLTAAQSAITALSGHFDSNGVLKTSSFPSGVLSGYLKTNDLDDEINEIGLGGLMVSANGNVSLFSILSSQSSGITSLGTRMSAAEGTISTQATAITSLNSATAALQTFSVNASSRLASIENSVTNTHYLTNASGYLMVRLSNGSERPAQKSNGQPASNYSDVKSADLPYLILIADEISTIAQKVSEGVAATEILVSAGGNSAVFYAQAGEGGSELYMNADTVGIESDYFKLDKNGLNLSGDIKANTFSTHDSKTWIGTDGILHAEGAIITGDVAAKTFSAYSESAVSINVSNYVEISGNITKATTIDGESFSIVAGGALNGHISQTTINKDISGNSIYFKIVDYITNPYASDSNCAIKDSILYGVPVLCMTYEGKEYMMSPLSWFTPGTSGDSSNIRWVKISDVKTLSYTAPSGSYFKSSSCSSPVSGTYYVFRQNYGSSGSTGTPFISNIKDDSLYRLSVLDYGSDSSATIGYITNNNLATGTTTSAVNSSLSYTLYSKISDKGYTGTGSITHITNDVCSIYKGYLPSSGTKYYRYYYLTYPHDTYVKPTSSHPYAYKKFIDFMRSLMKKYNTEYNNYTWYYGSESYTISAYDGGTVNGFLPFDDNNGATYYDPSNPSSIAGATRFDNGIIRLNCYPEFTFTANGRSQGTTISRIIVNADVHMESNFPSYGSTTHTLVCKRTSYGTTTTQRITDMNFTIEFSFVIDFSSPISAGTNVQETVTNTVNGFLSSNDITSLISSTDYSKYIAFSGRINLDNLYLTPTL